MRKAKFMRLKQIVSRINDPTLKRFDKLRETAELPGIELQEFLKVCRDEGMGLEQLVPADQANKVGEELMQACRLGKYNPSDLEVIRSKLE